MRRNLAALLCLLLLGGCAFRHGPREESLRRVSASGVQVEVVLSLAVQHPTRELRGELLEVRDDAIVLLIAQRVTLIQFAAMDRLRAVSGSLAPAASATKPVSVALRPVSRYPQGMPAVALRRLLDAAQQAEPTLITRQP